MVSRICFSLLFVCHFSIAQKYEPGKITVKDLEEKRHAKDTSAVAAVLYNKGLTKFDYTEAKGFSVVHTFEMRIKIYKKEGLQYANYEVPYFIGYEKLNPDMLDIKDGVTYNLVNGKIEKTKLSNEGEFRKKINKKWETATITLPNVKVGSIIEFSYQLKSEDLFSFPTFIFQRDIPVNFVQYRTEIPVTYGYKQLIKGFFKGIETKSAVESNSIGFHNSTTSRTDYLQFSQITTTFTGRDIPSLKTEEYVDNIENYRSAVNHELEVIREVDEKNNKDFSQTWEGVAKKIYEDEDFGKQLHTRGYFETELRQLINGIQDYDEKLKVIYDYVKLKMNWNGEFGYTTDKGVQKAWVDRTGNSAEINFILISMLNSAGVIAYPVLISTIKNGIPVYPNQTGFNYVVATCEFNGKRILLDACAKNASPGILPLYALNWTGRLITKDGNSEEIDLQSVASSKSSTVILASLDEQGRIAGQARFYRTDYEAFDFREKYAGINQEQYLDYLENRLGKISISNYVLENNKNLAEPIKESFDFSSGDLCEIIGDRMYLNPVLFLKQDRNVFSAEERNQPLFFGFPKQSKMIINIQIPKGYSIESMPQPIAVATPESVAYFKYEVRESGGTIQLSVSSEMNNMVVSQDFYPVLKDFSEKCLTNSRKKLS